MAIINRLHPDIKNSTSERKYVFMSLKGDREFYFTKAAVNIFKLEHGKFLHFDKDDNGRWSFFQNDDSSGFRIQLGSTRDKSLKISNKALMKMFRKETRYTEGNQRFLIFSDGIKRKSGETIINIHTAKPYDML